MSRPEHDLRDRAEFNRSWRKAASNGEAPQLEALTNGHGKANDMHEYIIMPDGAKLRIGQNGFYTDCGCEPGFVSTSTDASHAKGVLTIESSTANRRAGAQVERLGETREMTSKLIDGIPIEQKTAEMLESRGVFRLGTVANAPAVDGRRSGGELVGLQERPRPSMAQQLTEHYGRSPVMDSPVMDSPAQKPSVPSQTSPSPTLPDSPYH